MEMLSWREVDFAGVVLAGFVAGYLMAMVGLWAGSLPRLVAIDIADIGRRYMMSDRPSAWLMGMVSHLINSILLVLLWASMIEPNLSWPRALEGLVWGEILAVLFSGALIAPLSGLGFMGRKTGTPLYAVTSVLMHGVWGLVIGILYSPIR
jgi:hypothetical protein